MKVSEQLFQRRSGSQAKPRSFQAAELLLPNNCSRRTAAQPGRSRSPLLYQENLLPFRTIVRSRSWCSPIPIPIHRGFTCLKPNNFPDYAPIQPRSPRSRCDPNNSSVIVHTPCASKYASFWVLRYFVLSSLGLYGWLWLFSCVSVLCLEIPVVLPVFLLLSYCQSSHVAHEPY